MRNLIIDFYNKNSANSINYLLQISSNLDNENDVLVITDSIVKLSLNNVNKLIFLLLDKNKEYKPQDLVNSILYITKDYDFITLEANDRSNEIANLIAAKENKSIFINANSIKKDDDKIILTKQIYSNYLFRDFLLTTPVVCTIYYNKKVKLDNSNNQIITKYEVKHAILPNESVFKLKNSILKEKNDLVEAEKVVLIGKGVRQEDIEKAKEFASLIGAKVGATRPVTYLGLMPLSSMIGSSNLSVSPKVLIALGVSGSAPLLTGIKNSLKIIAVNNDKSAMIFNHANIGILLDTKEFLETAISKLKEKND